MNKPVESPAETAKGWTATSIYTLGLLTTIYAFNIVDRHILGLLIPLIKADLKLSDTEIGLLSGFAFAAFYVAVALPIGSLADRWNRRNIIAIGLAFWSAMMALHAVTRTGWQLALVRFFLGAGEATNVPPSNSMIADLFGPAQRPFALGFFSAGASIGILVAFPVLGHVSGEYGWRASFVAAGLPGLALALLFFLTVREPPRLAPAGHGPEAMQALSLGKALRRLVAAPPFVLAVAAGTFTSFNMAVMQTWAPAFLSRVHDLSQSEIGSFVGLLRGVGGLAGAVAGGWLASWLGGRDVRWRYRVPALAMLLVAPAQLLLIFGGSTTWKLGLAIETLLVMAQFGPFFAILLAAADSRTRAVAIATFLFSANIFGQGTGPLVSGYVSDLLTPSLGDEAIRYALLTATAATVLAGVCCFAAGRRIAIER